MGKTGCPVCGKGYGAGHWSVVDCPQIKSEVKVEKISQPELPAPGVQVNDKGTVQVHPSTVHLDEGTVPKNRRWESLHREQYREWRREYMRRRRQ